MISSLYSGVTGLNASTQRMGVIGDNIANVNTVGYKGSEISFESMVSQSIGGYTGMEIGGGVMLGDLRYDWNQGTIQATSNPYDIAITGSGFFTVQDPVDAKKLYYTRDGSFSFDAAGNLTTSSGMIVQVFKVDPKTGLADKPTPVLIAPPTVLADPATYNNVTVDDNGVYWGTTKSTATPPSVKTALGQIAVVSPKNQSQMAKMSGNLYTNTEGIDGMNLADIPGASGLGTVATSSLEMSNVDIAKEFVNMITAQRAFSASSKVITTSDEILQELISMKR
jgi:flagellar hook protein FlgE